MDRIHQKVQDEGISKISVQREFENYMGRNREIPSGIYAAVLTPLHSDLNCNLEELISHSQHLIKNGCRGIALFGTTGEGPSFSLEERTLLLEKFLARGFDPALLMLGNGSSGIDDTARMIRHAKGLGVDQFLIAPPCFYKNVSEDGVINYYREVIKRSSNSDISIVLYHIPQLTGVPITMKVIEALHREFPHSILGIKESEGNLDFTKEILKKFPQFQLFAGNERHIIEAMRHGASGGICGMANLYPELLVSLFRKYNQDLSDMQALVEALFQIKKKFPFTPTAKAIMKNRKGGTWHLVRPPLMPLQPDEANEVIQALQNIGLELQS